MATELHHLFEQYLQDRPLSRADIRQLSRLWKQKDSRTEVELLLQQLFVQPADKKVMSEAERSQMYEQVQQQIREQHLLRTTYHCVHFLKTTWFRYAAAVILLFGLGTAIIFSLNNQEDKVATLITTAKYIAPGSNKAILTIGTNKPITLSGNKTGISINKIITYNDGENLVGADSVIPEGNLVQLTTPRGGQYQAVLPDGSKAWLNAASSIRFPSNFNGSERTVEVTGEVYLEVTTNRTKPFFVKTGTTAVQVLGTSFNVNAYTDEPAVKISLLSGSVKVGNTILKPGQAYEAGKLTTAHIEQDIAWKNGLFNLQNADMRAFGRQIQRWYDVQVNYEGSVPAIQFKGEMDRGVSLSGVLEFLAEYGIKTRLEGKTLIIVGR